MTSKGSKNENSRVDSSANSDYSQKINFAEADRQKSRKIYESVASLKGQVSKLQKNLKKSNQKIEELKTDNEKLDKL